jgi:hypothetical protein
MKKQTLTLVILCVVIVGIVWYAISTPSVRLPASNEEAIMTYLKENFGESKTSWLDDIDSIETSGDTVVVASRKARRNDALDMCEAVSTYIYSANVLKPAVTRIEIRYSGKIIARRNGQADHCG